MNKIIYKKRLVDILNNKKKKQEILFVRHQNLKNQRIQNINKLKNIMDQYFLNESKDKTTLYMKNLDQFIKKLQVLIEHEKMMKEREEKMLESIQKNIHENQVKINCMEDQIQDETLNQIINNEKIHQRDFQEFILLTQSEMS